MPELPEVHNFKQYFDAAALGRTVEEVSVADDKIIRNMEGETFAGLIAGRTFQSSYRRGKYLFGRLDNGHDVLLHFGMTGDLNLYRAPEDQGRFERFAFVFTDGDRLGFDDARKFARVLYLEDRDEYIQEIGLGPDALEIAADYLVDRMAGRKTSLKGLLLNQKIVAGIGNLYADEICYRCRLHPALPVNQLTPAEKLAVAQQLIEIMTYATENAPYYNDYPADWFWHVWREEGKQINGGEVKVMKVAGRTTYYVEGWQRI